MEESKGLTVDEIKELIGKEVWYPSQETIADIVSFGSGWVTISFDDKEGKLVEKKVRAKEVVLMDSEEDLNVSDEGNVELAPPDPSLNSSEAVLVPGEFHCACGRTWVPPKTECFKCPDCGRWHRVRLHPDMSRYVKGMAETPSGRDTVDIDDYVAGMLRGMDLDDLYATVCSELNSLDVEARFSKPMAKDFKTFVDTSSTAEGCAEYLAHRYHKLNFGMQHMNMRNLLRGAIKRQEAINDRTSLKGDVKKELAKGVVTIHTGPIPPTADSPDTPVAVIGGGFTDGAPDIQSKEWIDSASFEDLLRKNRFAPVGDPMMMGDTGVYFLKMLGQRKEEVGEEEAVAASKRIGWGK